MLQIISESTQTATEHPIGENVFRSGRKTRMLIQQINEEIGNTVAHFVVSDVDTVIEVISKEDNVREVISRANETFVFESDATGEVTNWAEVVGSGISNIPEVLAMLEEYLGDEFDDLPASLQTNRSSELL